MHDTIWDYTHCLCCPSISLLKAQHHYFRVCFFFFTKLSVHQRLTYLSYVVQELIMSDLMTVKPLGAGGFGKVNLVKWLNDYYALKIMSKGYISEHNLVTQTRREKEYMRDCECPWLVNLVATTNDDQNVYMLMEAVMGGELFSYLSVRIISWQGRKFAQ